MTPTPKEGPPTLRECRERLLEIEHVEYEDLGSWCCPLCGMNKNGSHKKECALASILSRLTDEALELDEKRRAALEEVADSSSKLRNLESGMNHPKKGEYNDPHEYSKLTTAWRRAVAKLDALTPTPKEKEKS